ncbi:MAG: hypothetical protein LBQ66_05595, partial [Planctomycetaceae bacterium]|nr:hypothetical protein [Planctomycetaceae bacterium]
MKSLKKSCVLVLVLFFGVLQVWATPVCGEDLYARFKNPPMENRPFVRWWWTGDKVNIDELRREIDVMKANGIGGAEINPIKFTPDDDLGIP